MKIGILTIQKAPASYGANLQCFALWKYLDSFKNVDPYVVDLKRPSQLGYKPYNKIISNDQLLEKKGIKTIAKKILSCTPYLKKRSILPVKKDFDKSWSQIKFTKAFTVKELYQDTLDFDVFIAGSDQIWNPKQNYPIEPFFLTFTDKKKISYASSFGIKDFNDKTKKYIKKWLAEFSSISVREDVASDFLKEIGFQNIDVCVDPTFLLNKEEWDEYSAQIENCIKEKYILFYSLSYDENFYEMYRKIANETKLKCIVLDGNQASDVCVINKIGPKDFISLVKNADYVVTNSFHCAVFSLIYDKPFSVIKNSSNRERLSRLESLLKMCNCNNRIYEQSNFSINDFDYADVDKSELDKRIAFSKEYLMTALNIEKLEKKNNIQDLKRDMCTGCGSCELSCPKKCIQLKENAEGFLYPEVGSNCINCGVCTKKCPILNPISTDFYSQKVYAVSLKDTELLRKSSSGGVFAGIATKFLENNGVVYGCSMESDFTAKIIRITDKKDLVKLQGSKYVASLTGNIYKTVKEDLDNGKHVLYSGLPCQIAGLKKYLGKDYTNLYSLDLICHGTPSQKLFKKYINLLQNKYKSKIVKYGFRDKDIVGWGIGGTIVTQRRKIENLARCDSYLSVFLKNQSFRESCYRCSFARKERFGDITIGDYWGVKKYFPEIDISNGVSVCLSNSKKGDDLLNESSELFNMLESNYYNASESNPNLWRPTIRPAERDFIYFDIDTLSEKKYFKKFAHEAFFIVRIKLFVKKLLKRR